MLLQENEVNGLFKKYTKEKSSRIQSDYEKVAIHSTEKVFRQTCTDKNICSRVIPGQEKVLL